MGSSVWHDMCAPPQTALEEAQQKLAALEAQLSAALAEKKSLESRQALLEDYTAMQAGLQHMQDTWSASQVRCGCRWCLVVKACSVLST